MSETCQATMDFAGKHDFWPVYGKCGKPAKYRVPNPEMKVEFLCGIHARSWDATYKRLGKSDRCIPLVED